MRRVTLSFLAGEYLRLELRPDGTIARGYRWTQIERWRSIGAGWNVGPQEAGRFSVDVTHAGHTRRAVVLTSWRECELFAVRGDPLLPADGDDFDDVDLEINTEHSLDARRPKRKGTPPNESR